MTPTAKAINELTAVLDEGDPLLGAMLESLIRDRPLADGPNEPPPAIGRQWYPSGTAPRDDAADSGRKAKAWTNEWWPNDGPTTSSDASSTP